MAIDRTLLVSGPAKVTQNGGVFFTKEDIAVALTKELLEITTSSHGLVDKRLLDWNASVPIVPDGTWNAGARAALFPYAATLPGASLLTAADLPLVIHSNNNERFTFAATALTKMPDLFLSATKTIIGPAEFTAVRKNNTEWNVADSFLAIDSAAYSDASFAPANIKVQSYQAVQAGVAGYTAFDTQEGWTIQFNLAYDPIRTDKDGLVDFRFRSLEVMVRGVPIQATPTQTRDALGLHSSLRGSSLQTGSVDLVITGADGTTVFTAKSARMVSAGYRFGATVLRNNEVGWVATRPFAAGVPGALFSLS